MTASTRQPRIVRSLDGVDDALVQDPAVRLRLRLAQQRAGQALPRRLGWLGSGNRWMAMGGEGCACGCGELVHVSAR